MGETQEISVGIVNLQPRWNPGIS